MKTQSQIKELDAKFEHLQERFDNLRDYIKENPRGEYYWNKFEDLLAWSLKFDKNSEEYDSLNKAAQIMLDRYLEILVTDTYILNREWE